jgi:hypothetical protein
LFYASQNNVDPELHTDELIPLIAELSHGDEIVPQAGRMTVRPTPKTGLAPSDATASLVHLDYTATAVCSLFLPDAVRAAAEWRVHLITSITRCDHNFRLSYGEVW